MTRPLGIFDSGIGGLSVWREIVRQLPDEATLYVADQAHIPYGPRPAEELCRYAEAVVRFLLARECKTVVVACNSASAAALKHLRTVFPATPFIGMEPAIKPAAIRTKSRVVVVLATPATLQGELFTATAEQHARGVTVIGEPCPGLVGQIESGQAQAPETEAMLRRFLARGLSEGADQIVLACTHYPIVIDQIRRIAGPNVEVIDPAPAVARQLGRVLGEKGLLAPRPADAPARAFFTTGADVVGYARAVRDLIGPHPAAVISRAELGG